VIYVATARIGEDDHEMRERIERHRADRPAEWRTVEEPVPIKNSIVLSILALNFWNPILNNRKLTC
jgi:adenosyl cobinamide kinase/adenosyl cobinamide phosphate guanylyltransferase